MRIAHVLGTVTLSRWHPTLSSARYKLAVPLTIEMLNDVQAAKLCDDLLVVYDDLGADIGSVIALSEGGEAAQPFLPALKPVDAYNAAILDNIHLATLA